MNGTVFIYGLNDPCTGKCRYVGKARNPQQRMRDHLCKSRGDNPHKKNWLNLLSAQGLKPCLEVLDEVTEDEWGFWEKEYIRLFRAIGFDLTNVQDGGEAPPNMLGRKQSPEHIERRCGPRRGTKRPASVIEKMRQSALKFYAGGGVPWNKGIPRSEETKQKIRATKAARRAINTV